MGSLPGISGKPSFYGIMMGSVFPTALKPRQPRCSYGIPSLTVARGSLNTVHFQVMEEGCVAPLDLCSVIFKMDQEN